MNKTSFDFIKYTTKKIKYGDFNGPDSSLGLDEQIDYLKKYKNVFLSSNNIDFNSKIISDSEVNSVADKIQKEENLFRNRQYLKLGKVSLVDANKFKYLHLYGNKTEIKNNRVLLIDTNQYPAPSLDLFTPFDLKNIYLSIKIDRSYITPLRGDIETTMMGKYIELRNNISDIGRIQIYSDGSLVLRILEDDIYHYTNILIGKIDLTKQINIKIKSNKGGYFLNINGLSAELKTSLKINYLLFSGGQYPSGSVKFRFIKIIDFNNNLIDAFTPNDKLKIVNMGDRYLPVSCGGYKNHNLSILYSSTFVLKSNKRIYIHLSSLNPGGEVYINDKLVFQTLTFLTNEIDISNFTKCGVNKIKIIAYPRSPENIISWHRNKDPYFASYIDEVFIEERKDISFENINLFTLTCRPIKAKSVISIKSNCKKNVEIKILIDEKIYDQKSLHLISGLNQITLTTVFPNLNLWSNDNPNLYNVKFVIKSDNLVYDEYIIKYGFRTITQRNGKLIFNNAEFVMKGALLMQYLPPYEDIVINHVCPTDKQIILQFLIAKKMNSNTVRMHVLGYGNNEKRYARIADYLGINIIWTTSYIDSLSTLIYHKKWPQKKYYIEQIKNVINNPSIIAYEGLNEMALTVNDISLMYKEFVSSIKKIDNSRLLCPISHLYYGGDSYQRGSNCGYIQDDGLKDQFFNEVRVCNQWNDKLVIRSAHTYNWLLGYGTNWKQLREQSWSGQKSLLESKKHAYAITEFAVIGRINPKFNDKSYEYSNEYDLNYDFSNDYSLSQTYQLLAAKYDCIKMLSLKADGLLWCSLISGANDGSYLKPIVDFNLYPKYAFEGLKECYSSLFVADNTTDIVWDKMHIIKPTLFGLPDYKKHDVSVEIYDEYNNLIDKKIVKNIIFNKRNKQVCEIKPNISKDGYYKILYRYN